MARRQTFEASTYYKFIHYEDFQPLAEWGEDKENNFLTVHLPGFRVEQINVTCVRSSRMIQLQGERKLANNKSSRFNQSFTLPQNCILENIQAEWKNEVITIIMPKLHPTSPVGKQEYDQKLQSDENLKQEQVDPPQAAAAKDQEKSSQESQKLKQEQAPSPQAKDQEKPSQESQKLRQEQAPSSHAAAAKDQEKTSQESQKLKQEQARSPHAKDQEKTRQESQMILKQLEQAPSPKAAAAAAASNASQKPEKETTLQKAQEETLAQVASSTKGSSEELKKTESDVEKEKEKILNKYDKSGDASKAKNLKEMKSVTPAAMENLDGQTITNMGVAVLVLMALGAYVSYSLGSKSK